MVTPLNKLAFDGPAEHDGFLN